mmetsp:Transcript_55983/g.179677  ORF Transcript_55983/g.179677 Transcript_55983/m.179677 type:complete len:233 (-) Transcript_55983:127-825(-)
MNDERRARRPKAQPYSSSLLSSNLMEFTPWSISPPPRQDARFFFAISFRKPLPLTFRRSSDALSAQLSPAESPNFCLAVCLLSRSLSSFSALFHFSSSMRLKGVPAGFSSLASLLFFFFFGGSSVAAASTAGAGCSASASASASASRFFLLALAPSCTPGASAAAPFVGAAPLQRVSSQSWQATVSSSSASAAAFLDLAASTSSSSPAEVSLSKARRVFCKPLSRRKRRSAG